MRLFGFVLITIISLWGSAVDVNAGDVSSPSVADTNHKRCSTLLAEVARQMPALNKIPFLSGRMLGGDRSVGIPGGSLGYRLRFSSNNYGPVNVWVEHDDGSRGARLYFSFSEIDFRYFKLTTVAPFKSLPFDSALRRFGPIPARELENPESSVAKAFRILFQ